MSSLFSDYLISELKTRFGKTQRKAKKLRYLAHEMVNERIRQLIETIGDTYAEDLPNRSTLDTDYRKWKKKWALQEAKPTSLEDALKDCVFPNIHALLRIACTMPVTSAGNERNKSVLKRLKTYLRATVGTDRLSVNPGTYAYCRSVFTRLSLVLLSYISVVCFFVASRLMITKSCFVTVTDV